MTKKVKASTAKMARAKNNSAQNQSRKKTPKRQQPRSIKLSNCGDSFIKTAFAPCDFAGLTPCGVPDGFSGNTVVCKYRKETQISTTAGKPLRILIAPSPGVAYYTYNAVTLTSSSVFTSSGFDERDVHFPSDNESANFLAFRYVGMSAEIVNTTNEMTWKGSIAVWKGPCTIADHENTAGSVKTCSGLDGFNSTASARTIMPFNKGMYSTTIHDDPSWEFTNVITGLNGAPEDGTAPYDPFGKIDGKIVGFGNQESIFFTLDSGDVACTFVLRVWATIEYLVNPNSAFYPFSSLSTAEDKLALKMYREIARGLPIGVAQKDNAKFWDRIKATLRGGFSVAKQVAEVGALLAPMLA